jgi:toxin ParE1/3/4
MANIIIRPLAAQDLTDIYDYIALDNSTAAEKLILNLENITELIATRPFIGRQREDLAKGLRSHTYGRYLILYSVFEGGIEIVRYYHGRRSLKTIALK